MGSLLTVTVGVLSSLAVLAMVQLLCARADARKVPPPGRLVEIPGGEMHVRQIGDGQPAVVLEAGIAASSLNWSLLQPRLAEFTTAYSYDRAGFGWSMSRSCECSLAKMSDDLHQLLDALEVPQPYLLVAHSFGAYIATVYAQHFPGDLAGIVLLDPLTPQEWVKPDRDQPRRLRRSLWFSRAVGALR